mgnify:CR=1 FL=1
MFAGIQHKTSGEGEETTDTLPSMLSTLPVTVGADLFGEKRLKSHGAQGLTMPL